MITPEIIAYIKSEKAKNTPETVIRSNLLANGWSELDISEALAALSGNTGKVIGEKELKAFRSKRKWQTFWTLCLIDLIVIMVMNGQGYFGISWLSVTLRLLVIYLIAYISSKDSKPSNKGRISTAVDVAGRVIGSVAMAIFILIGALFAACIFSGIVYR